MAQCLGVNPMASTFGAGSFDSAVFRMIRNKERKSLLSTVTPGSNPLFEMMYAYLINPGYASHPWTMVATWSSTYAHFKP